MIIEIRNSMCSNDGIGDGRGDIHEIRSRDGFGDGTGNIHEIIGSIDGVGDGRGFGYNSGSGDVDGDGRGLGCCVGFVEMDTESHRALSEAFKKKNKGPNKSDF